MSKKQIVFSIQVILFLLIMNSPLVFAETIIFKSGKRIEGKITEKTDEYVKLDVEGISLTFWLTEIERIEAENPPLPKDNMYKEPLSTSEYRKMISEVEKYFWSRKYEDSLLFIKKAIELNPNNTDSELYFALGIIYYYLDNFQDSISSFQKAITLKPTEAVYYLCLGIVYDSAGFQKEAKEALIKSIEQQKEEKDWRGIFIAEVFLKKIIK